MTIVPIPSVRSLAAWLSGLFLPICVFAQAPAITAPLESQSVISGSNVLFTVAASGAAPLSYQWRLFGTNVAAATNSALVITNVQFTRGGVYTVVIGNSFGSVTSAPALLNVDEHLTFRILELQTNGAIALEHGAATGDDRGGLVVTPGFVFVTGDSSTARFSAADLTGATALGLVYDSLCSNLRDQSIYLLGNGANIVDINGGVVDNLIQLDPTTGFPNGTRINLSTNIPSNQFGNPGIFSGYDRIVIWNGRDVYDISLPSGKVTHRGVVQNFSHSFSESWAFWGLAEYFNNTLNLIYVSGPAIVRRPVMPNSVATTVQQFSNLADMASIGFSVSRSRWYFHHEGQSQFRSGDETVGSAKALYTTNAGFPVIYQSPATRTNYPGDTVTLSAVVGGDEPFSYQWRFNGTNIAGATNASLILSNVQPVATGNYSVVVNNALGADTSGNGFLFVVSAPQILVPPQPISALPGTDASFRVVVQAAPPVFFQWRHSGTNIPDATNATYSIPFATSADAGTYNVVVTNRYGSVTSSIATLVLIIESAYSFKILNLGNDAIITEHLALTGDDAGGIAVSSNRVFVTGDGTSGNGATAIFSAADLTAGMTLAFPYRALVTDLRTERVYSLGDRTNLFLATTSRVVTTLIEIDGNTGSRTTNIINLSQPIPMTTGGNAGLFSGYGQMVIHNGSQIYSIALPSGVVADLGDMPVPAHQFSETWAYWGLAENFGGSVYLVYAQSSISIVRTRVPDGVTTTIANFINLADMASMGASVRRGRWYFHYQGASEFGGTNETVGFCSAEYSILSNPVVDHFRWEPLPDAQFSGVPFTATITARSIEDSLLTNFSGQVSFAGFTTLNNQSVGVTPGTSGNFSNGVWSGQLVVAQPTPGMSIRANDLAGRFGLSAPFAVVTTNDLAVQVEPSTNAATLYAALTYNVLINNSGPQVSSTIFATNILPPNVNFISAVASQGSCSLNAGTVVCDIGTMPSATSATIAITVVPNALGTLTNVVRVVRSAVEEHPENNTAITVIPMSLPAITFSDSAVVEGDSAATRGTNVFTVQLNTTSAVPITVQYATAIGTASNTVDYVNRSGTLTFAPGVTSTNIRVTVVTDVSYERDEFYFLNFSNASNAVLIRTQAVGTILNDDPAPLLQFTNAILNEGNSGTTTLSVPVRLSNPAAVPVSINYATANGTANAGSDYSARSGLLYFPNGVTNLVITVPVTGDTVGELDEFFYISLFNGTNIVVNTQIVVTIINDDAANVLHHFTWGNIAPTQVLDVPFTATLNARDAVDRTLSNYNGSARLSAGVAPSGTEHILGGLTTTNSFFGGPFTIGFAFIPSSDLYVTHVRHYSGTKVSIWTDTGTLLVEQAVNSVDGTWTETALPAPVKLKAGTTYRLGGYNGADTNPWYYGGILPPAFKDGTITNAYYAFMDAFPTNDLGASLYFVDLTYTLSLFTFSMTPTNVTLTNGTWSGPVRVQTPGEDVRLFATDVTALFSGTSEPFDVLLIDDIGVQIIPAANPAAASDNLVYSVVVSNVGPSSSTGVFVTNQLPANSTYVSATVNRGTLTFSNNTVVAAVGTLTNGESALLTVAVHPNAAGTLTNIARVRRNEGESYTANNNQTNFVTVVNLGVSIQDVVVREGQSGTTNARFNVTLSAASTQVVSVAWFSRGGTNVFGRGTAGEDFPATNGVLVFPAGTTDLAVVLPVFGDLRNEPNETFDVVLLVATNASIIRTNATGLIINDDPVPMISVSDISVAEGRTGFTEATFTLTLSQASALDVSVFVETLDGTANELSDYIPTNTFVTFSPGENTAQMTVFVLGDALLETDETFFLNLSASDNATLATAQARALILNDEVGAGVFDRFEWSIVPSPQTIERPFSVTITARDGVNAILPFTGTVALTARAGTNAVAFTPTNTTAFANGIWNGALLLLGTGSNVVLTADDGAGHTGDSNPFDVNVADVRLSGSTPPEALIESPFNYTLVVSNAGPNSATAISITNVLSPNVSFVSANSSAGACSYGDGVVTCNVGALTNGGRATITIVLSPLRGGSLTNISSVIPFEFDPLLTNNVAVNVLTISGDEDADGLPDSWEAQFGLSSSNPNDAQQDMDGDRHTNLQEYIAGTDPTDPTSVLKAFAVVNSTIAQISFMTVTGRRYMVESAPAPAGPWTGFGNQLVGEGDVAIVFDPDPATQGQRFYRVRVLR